MGTRKIVKFLRLTTPIPCSTKTLARMRIIAGGRSQNDTLFSRGKAMSGAPTRRGAI